MKLHITCIGVYHLKRERERRKYNQIVDSGVICIEDINAFGFIKLKFDGEFTTSFGSSFSTVVEPGKRSVVLIRVDVTGCSVVDEDVGFDGI